MAIVVQCRDTMEPTISDGDYLLIDRGTKRVIQDSIYAISSDSEYKIQRMQTNLDHSIVIRCNNQRYGEQLLVGGQTSELEIIGNILIIFHKV